MRTSSLLFSIIVSAACFSAVRADDTTQTAPPPPHYREEGRPAEPVPSGADGVQLTPPPTGNPGAMQVGTPGASDPHYGGVLYERNRIKRTVPLDPAGGLDGRWDVLYSYVDSVGGQDQPGGSGVRTVYFDWDDDYIYLAMETPSATDVRFDIDARDDGWLRGADNLSIQVSPPGANDKTPTVTAQRFDTAQNRDRPVFAESPIPASAIKAQAGMTSRGTYGVTLALPRTEIVGLLRKTGSSFGLRADAGLLPAQGGAVDMLSVRPMLRLTLADSVAAESSNGLQLRVLVLGGRQKAPQDQVRLSLEARNPSKQPIRLARLFLRGSLGGLNLLDAATYTGVILPPGQTIKRDIRSTLSPSAVTGTYVIAGGAEWEDGTAIASLASFDLLEPFAFDFNLDTKPVSLADAPDPRNNKNKKKDEPVGTVRVAVASAISRLPSKQPATIRVALPDGWKMGDGDPTRSVSLNFAGDTQVRYFRIIVPSKTAPGVYPVTATLEVAGKSYTVTRSITVTSL